MQYYLKVTKHIKYIRVKEKWYLKNVACHLQTNLHVTDIIVLPLHSGSHLDSLCNESTSEGSPWWPPSDVEAARVYLHTCAHDRT